METKWKSKNLQPVALDRKLILMWISNIKAYECALKYGINMGNLHVNEFNIQ